MSDQATPVQNVPLTSSDERMHVLDENCWCEPISEHFSGAPTQLRHRDESAGNDIR